MSMEIRAEMGSKGKSIDSAERSKIVEEVFKKYHKRLLNWCTYKFNGYRLTKKFVSNNQKSDSEEIVAKLYQNLLTTKNPPDLSRSEPAIQSYLNVTLDRLIDTHIRYSQARKRTPDGVLGSVDEILEEVEEENLPLQLKHYFSTTQNDTERRDALLSDIEEAIKRIEKRNPRMTDVLRKRYQEGKTISDISKEYSMTYKNVVKIEGKARKLIKAILERKVKSDLSIPQEQKKKHNADKPLLA